MRVQELNESEPMMKPRKDAVESISNTFVSIKSRTRFLSKGRDLSIHKRQKPLEWIAKELNPMIRYIIKYYNKFQNSSIRYVWNQLNAQLLKWVKCEIRLYQSLAIRWLQTKYNEHPHRFAHWRLVYP